MLLPPPASTLLSLHDALPIYDDALVVIEFLSSARHQQLFERELRQGERLDVRGDRSVEPACLFVDRSEEHTSELQSRENLVCRLLLEKKKQEQMTKKAQEMVD